MLAQRLRRCANIEPTMGERLVFDSDCLVGHMSPYKSNQGSIETPTKPPQTETVLFGPYL